MNLFKKFLLVLCLAISVQPAYGWSWGSVASSVTNFITSSIPLFFSQAVKTASEHKTAVAIGVAGLLALTATKYAYGRYSDNKKAQEKAELERKIREEGERLENEETARQEARKIEAEQMLQEEAEQKKFQEEADRKRLIEEAEELKKDQEAEKLRQEEERKAELAREEAARREAERKRLEEERVKREQLEIERKLKEKAEFKAQEEARKAEQQRLAQGAERKPLNLNDNIISSSFRSPAIENYLNLNLNKFQIDKLSIDKLSELIKGTSSYSDLISSGANLVWDILYTDNIKNNIKYNDTFYNLENTEDHEHRNSYLADIVRVCWFMYSQALHKNNNNVFDEVSFVVFDNEDRIFNFLLNYVKKVNPVDWDSNPAFKTDNPYGYCRVSKYIKGCQIKGKAYKHFGIDIRFGQSFKESKDLVPQSSILPAGKTHILFGRVDKYRIFIKMENDRFYHLEADDGGILNYRRHELLADIGKDIGNGPTYRTEHVPKIFTNMAKNLGLKITAIYDIFTAYQKDSKNCNAPTDSKYYNLMQEVKKQYPLDYKARIGNEIVLDPSDLQCSYYYQEKATQEHKEAIRNFVQIKNLIQSFVKLNSADKKFEIQNQIQNLKKSLEQLPEETPALPFFIKNNEILQEILKFK